ncbi:death-associated protein kinase 1-like isoform X2 [Varroa jacobsoni]|uniref:death-associated protein kinase 1-like isoform X2 n=1 Tax=Varroa jacobsoni TaxID=62625 RepID=UPI000BF5AA2D|nr:death-associated protein kinase 1-like isoform X2 [Varroa jacobsoni]XP_022686815.1 death-associated protein kinase 1-like isoform X2 [Varroa jacobsoni]XP_022686816.1 death-associated protein kinase 1-like isoform X2 [Varroa jacobsoni]XP_022686817.1 death-associated protein kinase 1-like isoform X2 [Varroa jacobsoni]XP_022686818.1 death-associated protein kinase 1-like isoform X2 [Varroa jacobsoni]XP_022686819.1 death-associated protein kinase 1-like isoform X2 [Varroa jacobsoni]
MASYGVPQEYGTTVAATGVAESQTLYFDPAEEDYFETEGKNFVVVQTMRDEAFILAELFAAVEEGNLAELEDLFAEPGVDPNMNNKHGETVAHIAAGAGRLDVLRFLETRGANFDVADSHGDSAMYWAARQGHTDAIQYLWEQKAKVNTHNKQGEYPLHVAARYGHRAAVKLLCSLGANINNVDEHGDTALHIAAWHDFPAIMYVLCQAGALTHLRNKEGETALHAAASRGHTESVRCLLEAGAELELLDKHACSALHLALRRHHVPVALVLLQAGCPNDVLDNHGDAPIHVACRDGLLSLVESLCALGCNIDVPNKAGLYPIHLAAKNGYDEIVRCLLLAGCRVDAKNRDGVPAEIIALAQGHTHIGELLARLKNDALRQDFVEQIKINGQQLARIKVKLLGPTGVGKSALVDSLKCGYFSSWFRTRSSPSAKANPTNQQISHSAVQGTGSVGSSINSKSKSSLISGGNSSRASTPEDMLCEVDSENNLKNVGLSAAVGADWADSAGSQSQQRKLGGSELDVFEGTVGPSPSYTRGIEIHQTAISGVGDVSLWDFSGQEGYLLTYDHFVGNPYSVHLLCTRLTDPLDVQIRQLSFWLMWLQGQAPPEEPLAMGGKSSRPLQVALVATHADQISSQKDAENLAQHVADQLQAKFGHVFDIHEQVFVLDAHSVSSAGLKSLKGYLLSMRTSILQQLPRSTGLLEVMLGQLAKWRSASPSFPVLTWDQFRDMVRLQINPLVGEEHLKDLVLQLTLIGEVVYSPSDTETDMVVLTPHWLGSEVIGDVLAYDEIERARPTGCFSPEAFQLLCPEADAVDLLQVLENLKLCTQYDNAGEVEYEFPCYFRGSGAIPMDGSLASDTCNSGSVWDLHREHIVSSMGTYRTMRSGANANFTEANSSNKEFRVQLGVHIVPFDDFSRILPTLFPRIQVHLRRMALINAGNGTELLQWRYGSRYVNEMLEGVVLLERSRDALEVKVRGPADTHTNCFYFMEELLTVIDDVLLEVCPGIAFQRNLLSIEDLKNGVLHAHAYPATQVMRAMLTEGLKATVEHPDTKKKELITDLLGCERVGTAFVPGPSVHSSQLSVLTRQKLGAALDPPERLGRDWCLLAVQLGCADILPRIDCTGSKEDERPFMKQTSPHELSDQDLRVGSANNSPIANVLHHWSRVSQSSIGALATALLELGREDGAAIVLGTSPLLQIVPPATDGAPGPPTASLANSKLIPESHPQNSGLAFSQGGQSPRRSHHASAALSSASSTNMSR